MRTRTHPGEILKEEFLEPMGISANRLAIELMVPATRISEIIRRRRSITADTALRLSRFFGTTARFWLNLQAAYDLSATEAEIQNEINRISPMNIQASE